MSCLLENVMKSADVWTQMVKVPFSSTVAAVLSAQKELKPQL